MIRSMTAAVLIALWVAVPCAAKGVIRGTLRLPVPTAADPDPGGAPQGHRHRASAQLMDAVVYLEPAPEKIEKKLAKKARHTRRKILQQDLEFVPRVLPVVAGDTVWIENHDRVYHNAFSVSPARRFDLGKYAPGKVAPVDFGTSGVVNLHCDIHPKMVAFVVVVPNHLFIQPDLSGRYAFPRLPPGSYTVHVWHAKLGTMSRVVDVAKKGDVSLDLRF